MRSSSSSRLSSTSSTASIKRLVSRACNSSANFGSSLTPTLTISNPNSTTKTKSLPSKACGNVAEQCCRHVLDELVTTEQQYVEDLFDGINRYTRIFQPENELPDGLMGQQDVLLANVAQIAAFHRHKMLPLMLQHRGNLELLFEGWTSLIEGGGFNCYVLFAASQRDCRRLYDSYELYFKRLQITLADPLGVLSFLLKPVQRITKYPLLLSTFIQKFFENRLLIPKGLIEQACRTEARIRELLDRVNQSDQLNDIRHFNAFSVLSEANFIMVGEFIVHESRLRRSFNGKLFAFDTCLIYTERKGGQQQVRGTFTLPDVCFVANSKSFVLCNKKHECEFLWPSAAIILKWESVVNELVALQLNRQPVADLKAEKEAAAAAAAEVVKTEEAATSRSIWYVDLDSSNMQSI